MPRDGSGHGDNAIETDPAFGQTIAHGAGGEAATSTVDRSGKAAAPPSYEKGEAIEGMNASGGGNKITDSGKGPLEPAAEAESKKH
ncbi:hypothetical protein AAFC00_006021 [Neodothiora populina]|uniref:Uncharacterized protein n=1 Tax=Neodothiora populina TaxID=2781224 RepID=A0ABR3P823_9PEZI